jgi:predicted DNA-binding protein with PD1-like motif
MRKNLADRVKAGEPVPSPLAFSTDFERIVTVRMTYDTDVLEGLKKAVGQENIRNAVFLSGIGSLKSYNVHSVSNTTFPSQNVFFKGEGPYDLTAVNGYVIGGRVHAHITFSNEKTALGGHLEPGTKVFTFCIVTLGIFRNEIDLNRLDDKNWR